MIKPAYEIVTVCEVRVGDVVEWNGMPQFAETIVNICLECDHALVDMGKVYAKWPISMEIYRQLPPERNPDVLMRALKIAERNSVVEDAFGRTCQGPLAGDYIQQAIRELKKEREG